MSRSKERVEIPRLRSSHSEWTGLPLGLVGLSQARSSSLRTRGVHTNDPDPAMKEGELTSKSSFSRTPAHYRPAAGGQQISALPSSYTFFNDQAREIENFRGSRRRLCPDNVRSR